MELSRLSTDEFLEKMRSCRHWAVNMNRAVMELQLTVCTQADIFENWFGPDPRDVGEDGYLVFIAKVNRAKRIYHDRELLDIMPDGGYPTFRAATPEIHRVQNKVEFRKIQPKD